MSSPAGVRITNACKGVDRRDAKPPTKSATPHTTPESRARRAATEPSQHMAFPRRESPPTVEGSTLILGVRVMSHLPRLRDVAIGDTVAS